LHITAGVAWFAKHGGSGTAGSSWFGIVIFGEAWQETQAFSSTGKARQVWHGFPC
jgi:hypothetical protein